MEDDKVEPNADTPPPGSSESFNDFKDRILSTMGGYASSNEGHNTVFVTHSKAIGTINGWEHAGYPEDGSIHMPTYEEAKEKAPGGHEEIELPQHAVISPLPKPKQEDESPSIFSPEFWYSEERANKVAAQAMEFRDKFNQDPIEWIKEKLKGGDFSKHNPTDVMPLIGQNKEVKFTPTVFNTSNERTDRILHSVINEGKSYTQVAQEEGTTRSAIGGYVKRYKDNPEGYVGDSKHLNKYPRGYWKSGAEGDKRLFDMHHSGMTATEISNELELDVTNVRKMLNERDLVPNQTLWSRIDYKSIKERLEAGENVNQISKDLGIPSGTIYNGLKVRNIKYRDSRRKSVDTDWTFKGGDNVENSIRVKPKDEK